MKIILALALAMSGQAFAAGPSLSEESFCQDRKDESFVKDLTQSSSNLMSFVNSGGIGNGGVCWWHSRFQRSALYLTFYNPTLPKPTAGEASELIKRIRAADGVVMIPGFKNFSAFTLAFKAQIQKELEKWQKSDGVAHFRWVDGLSGSSKLSSVKLKEAMDQMYQEVEVKKNILYNKLQVPGIMAHAWTIVHMTKVPKGYDLEVLDSNAAKYVELYEYREGQEYFTYHSDHSMVSAPAFKKMMDEAYDQREVRRNYSDSILLPGSDIQYWEVISLSKIDNGYDLKIMFPHPESEDVGDPHYKYHYGDTVMNYAAYADYNRNLSPFKFVPYVDQQEEMAQIKKVIAKKCHF